MGYPGYDRKSLFFSMFLEYPKIWDTLDMTENHCFSSSFRSIRKFGIPWIRPKIIVFHYVFGVSQNLGYPGYDRKSLFFIIFLEYPKIWDTLDMTENHCFSSSFWSIRKYGIPWI